MRGILDSHFHQCEKWLLILFKGYSDPSLYGWCGWGGGLFHIVVPPP